MQTNLQWQKADSDYWGGGEAREQGYNGMRKHG
jgi:hypothetical protein